MTHLYSSAIVVGWGAVLIGLVLERMVYGVVCFATLFGFADTVLGGICWISKASTRGSIFA